MVTNKKELYHKSLDAVNEKIEKYQQEMDMIKESMDANDTKTDYDEDNKGQLLADFEKNAEYLNRAREMKETLAEMDIEHYSESIDFGSVVETDNNYYFVSVPLGELEMEDGSTVFAISTEAPIYEAMKGKRAGDTIKFNGQNMEIKEVH